ncbi:O-antigen ligase family protein [Aureispira anguillae]|uniref:O-antigen ligase-related domain-containing protein n=1 Tax=Aureispira anguillae TaxID=2864201 RepID=A0A915VMK7_9BACT|nr:O-antigen ligase family protein [Aureispira anguillae]BDS09655.1 hypothetical protein AsAng_0003590 [Aureispira anguillae]
MIFFFNKVLLPFGLQYSILLTPFFIYYLHQKDGLNKLRLPFILLGIYSLIHLCIGVVIKDFMISTTIMVSLIIYVATFFQYYKSSIYVDAIIKKLTQLNFGFTLLALLSLISNQFVGIFWYLVPFTAGYQVIPRLKLFELEASHYSLMLLPLFFYYFWLVLKKLDRTNVLLFLSLALSLTLSFSLGVIAVVVLSISLVLLIHALRFIRFKATRNKLGGLILIAGLGLFLLFILFPDNPLLFRIHNILSGADTSGRGRTYEAFEIGWQVLQVNNPYFGIGLGQFKIIGREILIYYYQFSGTPQVARLPNCMAETLVVYGGIGFALKLLFQCFLFLKFKVYNNIYQLSLFLGIFIYQFTGSYLFNSMEYIIWVMAIYPKFSSFHCAHYFKS